MTTFLAWVGGIVAALILTAGGGYALIYWLTSGFTRWE